jgi:hypothetical protein
MHRGVLGCGGCGVACRCGGVGGKWQSNRERDVHRPPNSTPFSHGLVHVRVPAYARALSFSAHSLRGRHSILSAIKSTTYSSFAFSHRMSVQNLNSFGSFFSLSPLLSVSL